MIVERLSEYISKYQAPSMRQSNGEPYILRGSILPMLARHAMLSLA